MNMIDGKSSVRDVLLILSNTKIYRMERLKIVNGISKKINEPVSKLNIDPDILHKTS